MMAPEHIPGRYRVATLAETGGDGQEAEAIAWCAANGLDAHQVPAQGSLRIVGDEIHVREYADDRLTKKPWRVVPMASAPEDHGLTTHEVIAADVLAARLLREPGIGPKTARLMAPVVQQIIADEVTR